MVEEFREVSRTASRTFIEAMDHLDFHLLVVANYLFPTFLPGNCSLDGSPIDIDEFREANGIVVLPAQFPFHTFVCIRVPVLSPPCSFSFFLPRGLIRRTTTRGCLRSINVYWLFFHVLSQQPESSLDSHCQRQRNSSNSLAPALFFRTMKLR